MMMIRMSEGVLANMVRHYIAYLYKDRLLTSN